MHRYRLEITRQAERDGSVGVKDFHAKVRGIPGLRVTGNFNESDRSVVVEYHGSPVELLKNLGYQREQVCIERIPHRPI